MGAYKKLNYQDVFVTDYIARKQWNASGSLTGSYNLETSRGFSSSLGGYSFPHDTYLGRSQELVFKGLDHLYYRDKFDTLTFTGSRDLSLQTTLTLSGSRELQTEVGVISIPKDVYGVAMQPRTFKLEPEYADKDKFLNDGYVIDAFSGNNQFIEDIRYWYQRNPKHTQHLSLIHI